MLPTHSLSRHHAPPAADSAAGAGAGGDRGPTTLAARLRGVAQRWLHDSFFGPGAGGSAAQPEGRAGAGRPHSGPEAEVELPAQSLASTRIASIYLAPGALVHPCGPGGGGAVPAEAYLEAAAAERAAHRPLRLTPLALAVAEAEDAAFSLSAYEVESTRTGRVCEGARIDALRFDAEAGLREVWVCRQDHTDELEAPGPDPAAPGPRLDLGLLRTQARGGRRGGAVGGLGGRMGPRASGEGVQGLPDAGPLSALAPARMARTATLWTEAWNVASASGALNPDCLEALLAPGFVCRQLGPGAGAGAGGVEGGPEEGALLPDMTGLGDAKAALQRLTDLYDVDEHAARVCVAPGTNAAFTHVTARLTRRTPQPPPPAPLLAEAVELLLFDPDSGLISAAYHFRAPLGPGPECGGAAGAGAGGPGVPAGALEGTRAGPGAQAEVQGVRGAEATEAAGEELMPAGVPQGGGVA
ncbi:hypothetical protein HYH03_009051 [Edaphochlamys debaryana]|uniref:Uncharacterized protein n=1 Tax=Edaphochlamys debaryana TaxID=47281 RepID=A0A835Y510_9CHLO|nr:hypothetical protein HYH03_009051 [Edaphochlamys debaryana]|eukprot:KAG2492635.1 hypothetical protein HYH03_009051 [Edaphochlamys debaryana]